MKIFGSIAELVKLGFRISGKEVNVQPAAQTATSPITITIPDVGASGAANLVTTADSGTVTSTMIASNTIANPNINSAAAIAYSKLAALSSGNILVGSAGNVATSTAVTGDITISNTGVTAIAAGVIVNADISASAAIADTKLATISTAGKVSNSATTATSSNTASAIVARDASGAFSAGIITASLSGNATSASDLATGSVLGIDKGGTGQTTQQAALTALAGTQTSGQYLRSNGVNTLLSAIQAADVPTLNQNTTGTAANITATSNSTLTTLSSLSLPGSQVSGNISGNAANVTGTVAIANGGTGQTTRQAAINALAGTQTANRVLRSDGTNTTLSQVALATDVSGTLPVANGGTGITSFGSGVATFLGTPSSANLASAVTDETGSGSLVFGTSPTLSSPQVNSSLVIQQIATPSNPSAGFNKIYTKSDGLLYKLDSSGNEVLVGSGAGGGGELNLVINPDGDTALDGSRTNDVGDWIDFGTGTTSSKTTTSTEIPLYPTKTNAIKVLNDGSGTDYTRMRMTLPPSLYNRKLKLAWEQEASSSPAYVSGDFKVEVWATTDATYATGLTKLSLSTDAAGVSSIPALTGRYQTTFDTTTVANLELRIVRVAGAVNSFVSLNNVVVGPGIQPQGAVVGEWQSFTPTFGNFTLGNGTTSAFYRRVGANIEVKAYISAGSSTSITGTLTLTMPLSLNIDGTKIATTGATRETFGIWNIKDNGANNYLGYVTYDTATTVNFTQAGATSVVGATSPITMGTSDSFEALFSLPIAEWAGSGTVQLAQNDVEYASNSKSDNTVSDTTSFAYGPAGSLIPNGAVGTTYSRVVKFQSVIQPTDLFILQVDQGTGQWVDIDKRLSAYTVQGTVSYGVQSEVTDSTTCTVYFGAGGFRATGATYASNGAAWSGLSTWRWRLRKMSAGSAVGFGIHQPGVSAGLVSASGLVGNTTGNAIASGYVGEFSDGIESTLTSFAGTGAWKQVFAVTLQPGRYNLEASGFLNLNGATVTGFALNINTTTATATGLTFPRYYSTSGTSEGTQVYVSRDVNISVATTFYVNIQADYTVATPRYRAYYKWTRIA